MQTRRTFIRAGAAGLASFHVLSAMDAYSIGSDADPLPGRGALKLRFALASDGHYGEAGTDYKGHYQRMIQWLNEDHDKNKLDFVIINGDLVHDRPDLLPEVKGNYLEKLKCPFYAVPGNHDHTDTAQWKTIFGYEDNYVIEKGDIALVLGNTANSKGNITGPDNDFLSKSLETFADKEIVFAVLHVPPFRWLEREVYFFDFPETRKILEGCSNLKAVFSGHDHSLDGVRYTGDLPYFFDSHIGGSWGTGYTGFRVVEVGLNNEVVTYQVNASQSPRLNSNKL